MTRETLLRRLPLRYVQLAIDLLICLLSLAIAYLIRFDASIPAEYAQQMVRLAPFVAVGRMIVNHFTGVYRIVWRYVGVREAILFAKSVAIVSGLLLCARLLAPNSLDHVRLPISIIILEGVFTYLGLVGSRLLRRILHESSRAVNRTDVGGTPTLLIGAGQNGLAIAKESLKHQGALGIRTIGFLDDDGAKSGMTVHGIHVLGTLSDIEDVIKRTDAKQVIITSNAVPSKAIVKLIDTCRPLDVHVRTVPGLLELLGTGLNAQSLREVRIEDLLSRDPVAPSMSLKDLGGIYRGKRIMVTGAGGSIGRELCRQLLALEPSKLQLLERDENNLFLVHAELSASNGVARCEPILADITDRKNLERVFKKYQPQVIFHAAAFKHVPMMERFPTASARNNVFGTKNLAELADEYKVESFVMISTDKAVNPTSVMGATKRLAEVVIQLLGPTSETNFSCVRFGNVLGSRGSVIPIFREQIRKGGPVTITHPEATRYFMTIPEASNLVLQAGSLGSNGQVFLLDMGEPVKIIDLARQMIHLSGASEEQVPIKIIGSRPGEKLFEELKTDREGIDATSIRKIFSVEPELFEKQQIEQILELLQFAIRAGNPAGIREALQQLGIGFRLETQYMTGTAKKSTDTQGRVE